MQPKSAFDTGFDLPESGAALHESLVRKVESVDGVEKAAPAINDSTSIAILDENGDRIGPPGGGPPQIAGSVEPEPFNPFTWVEGSAPATDSEVENRHARLYVGIKEKALARRQIVQRRIVRNHLRVAIGL